MVFVPLAMFKSFCQDIKVKFSVGNVWHLYPGHWVEDEGETARSQGHDDSAVAVMQIT